MPTRSSRIRISAKLYRNNIKCGRAVKRVKQKAFTVEAPSCLETVVAGNWVNTGQLSKSQRVLLLLSLLQHPMVPV